MLENCQVEKFNPLTLEWEDTGMRLEPLTDLQAIAVPMTFFDSNEHLTGKQKKIYGCFNSYLSNPTDSMPNFCL